MKNAKCEMEDSLRDKSIFLKGDNQVGVLLLHGWTAVPQVLLSLAKHFNSLGFTVSVPLLKGHGTKPEDLLEVDWKDWLQDAQSALDELKKKTSKIFVGGTSIGGDLAILLSKEKKVTGVISLGSPIRFHLHTPAKLTLGLMEKIKTYRKKYYPPWIAKEAIDFRLYDYYPVRNAREVVRLVEHTFRHLPNVTKPILIAQSKRDHLVAKNSPKIIFDRVSSKIKEIFWVENGYHVFADNEKVWKKIEKFISDNKDKAE